MLFSTFSFTISKHYCGEYLVDTAIIGKAKNCGMEKMEAKKEVSFSKKSCCKDTTEFVEAPTFKKQDVLKASVKHVKFIVAFTISYINIFNETQLSKEFYKDFSPPDLIKDIQVEYQTFLI